MRFELRWTRSAKETYEELRKRALQATEARLKAGETKARKAEGLFKQVAKCVDLLAQNPRHPGLQTHAFDSIEHPYQKDQKVFEAYVQNQTPGAYRLFWCYGPGKAEITIIAVTPHP
jgi:hypothetical protein